MIKLLAFMLFFISMKCFALQTPSNTLQIQYQKSIKLENTNKNNSKFSSVSQIPEMTYRYLDGVFSSFYKNLTFNTPMIDSTFKDNLQDKLFSIPLISANKKGIQLEMFGKFSDLSKQYLSNLSDDHALYNYIHHSEQINVEESQLLLGAGISFNTSPSSIIKIIISNHEMPGYGNSKALLGFEKKF